MAFGSTPSVLDIGVLVFREGLECILVLAALTAGPMSAGVTCGQPISAGVAARCVCMLVTWRVAVGVVEDLSLNISALTLQAVTGLVAVLILLLVMNWFFHKVYWAGWISMHTRKRQKLLLDAKRGLRRRGSLWFGFAMLGFPSF
jgi:high-affinity iron transporter